MFQGLLSLYLKFKYLYGHSYTTSIPPNYQYRVLPFYLNGLIFYKNMLFKMNVFHPEFT